MKYIKNFEKLIIEKIPQIGDYVICECLDMYDEILSEFLTSHIGRIIYIDEKMVEPYIIMFDENKKCCLDFDYCFCSSDYGYDEDKLKIPFRLDEILEFSENEEELVLKLATNKYNL